MSSAAPEDDEPETHEDVVVTDRRDAGQWELSVAGLRAGLLTYRISDGVITFLHAEVDPDREGRGLGSRLTRDALQGARQAGLRIRPLCPFVADFVARHRDEYGDLLA